MQDYFHSRVLAPPVNLMTITNIDIRYPYFIPYFIVVFKDSQD